MPVECDAHCHNQHFREPMLVTHRGLSGPAMLQVSSYWQPGDELHINLLPAQSVQDDLFALRKHLRHLLWMGQSGQDDGDKELADDYRAQVKSS